MKTPTLKKSLVPGLKKPKKLGGVQHSCNNNFAKAVSAIFDKKDQLSNNCLFKDWIPEEKNESAWLEKIEEFFISCKIMDEERDKIGAKDDDDYNTDENGTSLTVKMKNLVIS